MSTYSQPTGSTARSLREALASGGPLAGGPLAPWRRIAAGAARAFLIVVVSIAANLVTQRAQAEDAGAKRVAAFVKPADMRSGALLLKSENDRFVEAPLVGTDVDLTVSGPTARARVTQIFHNPTDGWVEAVYVYPLPEGAAVDTLKMVIGERVVVGDIKARQEAREIYEQAKAAGQKAGLMEQERPNIFTNSVANIGPGETVLVQIEYQEPCSRRATNSRCACRWWSRRATTRRRSCRPSTCAPTARAGVNVTDPVPDRDRITLPVLDPRKNAPVNPVTISVRLQAGFPLGEVKSHHHRQHRDRCRRYPRHQAGRPVPADRDFELTWKPAAEKAPSVGLFREHVGDADYLLAFVTPPAVPVNEQPRLARDRLRHRQFRLDGRHLDHAGQGEPDLRARPPAAERPLQCDPLRSHHGRAVHRHRGGLTPRMVAQAQAFVSALQARGGTEMVPAMQAALTDRRRRRQHRPPGGLPDRRRDRQRAAIVRHHHRDARPLARVHGRHRFGAEHVPDDARRRTRPRHLHPYRLGRAGRGAHARVVRQDQSPGHQPDGDALRRPRRCNPGCDPDLYRGEPVALAMKVSALAGTLEIKGRIGDRPWIVTLPLANAAEGKGLSSCGHFPSMLI